MHKNECNHEDSCQPWLNNLIIISVCPVIFFHLSEVFGQDFPLENTSIGAFVFEVSVSLCRFSSIGVSPMKDLLLADFEIILEFTSLFSP